MEKRHAEELVEGLKTHSGIMTFNEIELMNALGGIKSDSSRFYEHLHINPETITEEDRYHYLHITRVLRNNRAFGYVLGSRKELVMGLAKDFGINSTTHLSRKLRLQPKIVGAMIDSFDTDHPFSLLGRLDTYDISKEDAIYKKRTPILVIPGAGDEHGQAIKDWEEAETAYELESRRWVIPFTKKLSKEKYLAALD